MKYLGRYIVAAGFCFSLLLTTMSVKTDVQALLQKRKEMYSARLALEEDLRVLQAEHAYLVNPQRLALYAKQWGMIELQAKQLAHLDDILNPPVRVALNQP